MIIVPSISIKPHGIAIYDQYFETRPRREDDFPKPYRWRRPRQNDPEGIVSPKAARRIQAAIKWLLFFSKTKRAYNRDPPLGKIPHLPDHRYPQQPPAPFRSGH